MASTNEDVVVLATAHAEDGRQLLVLRHLPDRGTIEIGWWVRESGAVAPPAAVLELAAEAVEIDAVMRLCESLLAASSSEEAGGGGTIAETAPDADGARIVAVPSGLGLRLARQPDGGELVLGSRSALGLLVGVFPAARLKLAELGLAWFSRAIHTRVFLRAKPDSIAELPAQRVHYLACRRPTWVAGSPPHARATAGQRRPDLEARAADRTGCAGVEPG